MTHALTRPSASGAHQPPTLRELLGTRLERRVTRPTTFMGAGEGGTEIAACRRFLEVMADGGWSTPDWPTEFGGAGLDSEALTEFISALDEFEVPDLYPFLVGLNLVGHVLMSFGSPEQQSRWLPAIRAGAEIWCQMFSEPGAGSDLAALATRAVPDGEGGWRVTGQKLWTSRAHFADWGFLLARTDPVKHRGITAFALDMRSPGITVRPVVQMNGDDHFNEVFLDDVAILDEHRIGDVGQGWAIAISTLSTERASMGQAKTEIAPSQILDLVRVSGLAGDPLVRQRAAAVWSRLTIVALGALRGQAAARAGIESMAGVGAKIRATDAYREAADLAMHLLGPDGIVGDEVWSRLFLTIPSMSIRGGTDEIQRNVIGERALGLPREPKPT